MRQGRRSPSPLKATSISSSDISSQASSYHTAYTSSSLSSSYTTSNTKASPLSSYSASTNASPFPSSSSTPSHGSRRRRLSLIFPCFRAFPGMAMEDTPPSDKPDLLPPPRSHASRRSVNGKRLINSTSLANPGLVEFTIADIQNATNNFSPDFKIGQGGSGMVYKAKLENGPVVAVKRAKKYDKHTSAELQNEIKTMQEIEHLNLVKFYGYLEHEGEHLSVVEYVPNGTLREHLDCRNGKMLDFSARLDIAIDVGHAITYLHTYSDTPVIHRDIKSTNILLTDSLRAKVTDFGFAKLAPTEEGVTHISTQVRGTAGYLDPEYLGTFQLTEKSDVYSFGVLLVELVTGRRAVEITRDRAERVTAKWAMEKFIKGQALETLDPNIPENQASRFLVLKIYELALQCLAPSRRNRPSMKKCTEVLWRIRKDYTQLLNSKEQKERKL
ncbi:Nodulation receptor kinase [Rhynchospora pubera]|uniref:non-specific serine/threonine protein kinase n=1 Tax=Rhynchospora pubera TaxID=906938 RepID=A0AAV8E8J6_9POAL|nr:Nodulation receptor kinase [Rhynchospora pubera]